MSFLISFFMGLFCGAGALALRLAIAQKTSQELTREIWGQAGLIGFIVLWVVFMIVNEFIDYMEKSAYSDTQEDEDKRPKDKDPEEN